MLTDLRPTAENTSYFPFIAQDPTEAEIKFLLQRFECITIT